MAAHGTTDGTGAEERIGVTISDDGVADVVLDRADKMNALDVAMVDALVETAAALAADRSVRVVVLSGAGRAFCAGLDLATFERPVDAPGGLHQLTAHAEGQITHYAQGAVHAWTTLPVPVIAAVHGVALGGGIQLALGCDMRIVAPDATLSVLEIRWGLIPDMTGTQRLIELVGVDVAMELSMTGRMVDGDEALRLGLATRVADDPRAAAMALADEIAGKNPDAIRATKALFRQAGRVSEAEGFAQERAAIHSMIGTPNQREAVAAWFEKRPPRFDDPV